MKFKQLFATALLLVFPMLVMAQSIIQDKSEEELTRILEEVVVTGTGTEHLLKDTPVQTEVINNKVLRNFSGNSLEDILSMLATSLDFNGSDMGSGITMNGLGN